MAIRLCQKSSSTKKPQKAATMLKSPKAKKFTPDVHAIPPSFVDHERFETINFIHAFALFLLQLAFHIKKDGAKANPSVPSPTIIINLNNLYLHYSAKHNPSPLLSHHR